MTIRRRGNATTAAVRVEVVVVPPSRRRAHTTRPADPNLELIRGRATRVAEAAAADVPRSHRHRLRAPRHRRFANEVRKRSLKSPDRRVDDQKQAGHVPACFFLCVSRQGGEVCDSRWQRVFGEGPGGR